MIVILEMKGNQVFAQINQFSTFSGSKQLLLSLHTAPEVLNRRSLLTDVAEAERYFFASIDKAGNDF